MPLTGQIVLYGGSFNPFHFGHQISCLWLTQALNAQEVIIVPTFDHPGKSNLIDFDRRLKMCELSVKPLKRVSVSDIERSLPVPSRTINLIDHYKCSNLVLAIGSDLIKEVEGWKQWDRIKSMAKIVVIGRNDFNNNEIPYECYHYPVELSTISSSEIRKLASKWEDITGLVPSRVRKYIEKNRLYNK
ncbi:hypothetical protein LCGC14_1700030 [marine sediment metagenome]|uniref:Cytidyltransferase-like domain-containing protein n=1 Tax=marine sediment metagenome TaxID=412755 RepID=A0A0F9HIW2_9ZZZZ